LIPKIAGLGKISTTVYVFFLIKFVFIKFLNNLKIMFYDFFNKKKQCYFFCKFYLQE